MGDLLARIQTTEANDCLFPLRPDYGGPAGVNTVPLWANYFELNLQKPDLDLYLYEMTLEAIPPNGSPEKEVTVPEGKKLMQVIRCALRTSTFESIKHDIATDFGRTLISHKKLESKEMKTGKFKFWAENEIENEVPRPRKNASRFQMTLRDRGKLPLPDLVNYLASNTNREGGYEEILPIVQALDIVLGHYGKFSLKITTPKQGKCFPLDPTASEVFRLQGPKSSQGYLQGVRGFFATVRATTERTLVNCNACCGAFYRPGPLEDLFKMFVFPNQQSFPADAKRLEKAIQGLRVELTHLKDAENNPIRSIRTIFGLAHPYDGPRNVTFYHKEDEKTYTIADYWAKKGYEPIRNFALPVVNVGDKARPNLVPPHVCRIVPGQMAKRKLDSTQTADMVENARREPQKTKDSINEDAFRILGLENNHTLNSFGLSLNSDMITVQGRVLEKPRVIYKDGSTPRTIDKNGRWNLWNVSQVFSAGHLTKWGILRISRDEKSKSLDQSFEESFRSFLTNLRKTLGERNVDEPVHLGPLMIREGDEVALKTAFDRCTEKGIRFLMIVLPDNDASTYNSIKRIGDTEGGINTVCVLGEKKKFYKPVHLATQYFANVALKINLKLGGINHILEDQTQFYGSQTQLYGNTMVIGIDVTHPSPGPTKRTAPSVAAMVASVDKRLAQWPVDLRINTAGKEMVDLLGPMLTTRLELWKSKHGNSLPDNLLIYRDGVSESQYKTVLEVELGKVRNTCEVEYRGRQLPKITLIIVGKRHHTRFFKKTGTGSCTNPEYGTVIDTGVTEARNWDFFLQSHHALLGTARPAHYFVLRNEIFTKEFVGANVKISEYLHKLTYDMCYLCGRSTGPVSLPPPVFYADLACERSRCYGDFEDDISDTDSMMGNDSGNGSGRPVPYRPAPSNQGPSNPKSGAQHTPGSSKPSPNKPGSGSTASGKKENLSKKPSRTTESKTPDLMAGLTKKQKAALFEERMAAAKKAAQKGSSKAEEKPPEAKPGPKAEGKKPETKAEGQDSEKQAEAKKPKERAKVEIHPNLKDTMFYI